jgi:uncharacterized protein (TIGR03032 family)
MLERPIFIVAPPGSGASLLLTTLAQSPGVATLESGFDALVESVGLDAIAKDLRDRDGNAANGSHRLLAASRLRVPFLRDAFPGARFVFLYQEPRESDAAGEWASTASILLDDLEHLPATEWCVVNFARLVSNPQDEAERLCRFLEIEWDRKLDQNNARATIEPIAARVRDVFARPDPSPFRSVSTRSFAEILHRLGISLLVTTYQSGRMIAVRAENATTLNTHLKLFRSPMGLAIGDGRFALGTEREVWDYRNQPAVTAKVDPPGRHDAVFVPRNVHYTGDIRIHEIGYAGAELWIVNTRFSTLCTLDSDSSFVPRWRPKFVTHLAPEDRCHLNGMAIVDDRVRYVTALGITNVAGGWREKKNTGGVLIDVDSDEIVLSGLSMPHSPRKYGDRFWILESAKGTFAAVDLASGKVETIAELPGFTRGLAFAGRFAFIGLSQVRESNIFGGIPLVDRVNERQCGVWVVDLQSGQIAAFLRFQGIVQEIFDVQVLPGIRYPEILEPTDKLVAISYTLPDDALGDVAG